MGERARGSIPVTALRIEQTDVGPATAVIDDELLTLVVRPGQDERSLRLKLIAIDAVTVDDGQLALSLRNGTHLRLTSPEIAPLRDQILSRCRTLPELTRTLRNFGSRRGRNIIRPTEAAEQHRFFSGLMDARRAAGVELDPNAAIATFDALALIHALDETLHSFARERHGENGPARRALEAELVDLSEPLYLALRLLAESAESARSESNDLRLWRAWSTQLRSVFEAADRVWFAVDAALDATFPMR
jgi:hypothetical protein